MKNRDFAKAVRLPRPMSLVVSIGKLRLAVIVQVARKVTGRNPSHSS